MCKPALMPTRLSEALGTPDAHMLDPGQVSAYSLLLLPFTAVSLAEAVPRQYRMAQWLRVGTLHNAWCSADTPFLLERVIKMDRHKSIATSCMSARAAAPWKKIKLADLRSL